jgi:regulatory protein
MKSNKSFTPEQALAKLQDICSMSEICSIEAAEKLRRYNVGAADAERIIARLIADRFIDDNRFIRAFVRQKYMYDRWGRLKIRQALRLKRFNSDEIETALSEEIDEDVYYENLAAALRTKARQLPEKLDRADRDKLARFAAGRGYEPSLIFEMIPEEDFWRHDS